MTPAALAIIGATIICSSFISGIFGMAGGMILLGVLLNYFDVATGMILFSIIQLVANGWRVVQWRSYVLWPIFGGYVLGALISFAFMWTIAFVPDKAMVYLALGLMPFLVEALPAAVRPNIERVAGVRPVGAAQRADVEYGQAFFIAADDTVLETVELVTCGMDGILDHF